MTAAKNMDSASMGRAYANKVSMAYIVALTHAAVGLTVMDMDCAKTWLTMKTDLNTSKSKLFEKSRLALSAVDLHFGKGLHGMCHSL